MLIKGLLSHIYPSCKVRLYYHGEYEEYLAGDLFDKVYDDEQCEGWAMYKEFMAIFLD